MVGNMKKEKRVAYMNQSVEQLQRAPAHCILCEGCALKLCNTSGPRGKVCCN